MDKQDFKSLINGDLFRYCGNINRTNFINNLVRNPGYKYSYYLRKCQYHKQKKSHAILYLVSRVMHKKYTMKFGYEIPIEVQIGKGLFINHLGGITINKDVVIGENVNLTKGVTIGQSNRGSKRGVPIIGNKVWIGANAVIVGKISIGNNVLIAPNAYVNFDVPDNSIVVGNPAKTVFCENAIENYIVNVV